MKLHTIQKGLTTKTDVITDIYNKGLIKKICQNVKYNDSFSEDIQQDIYVELLCMSEEKIMTMYEDGGLIFYIVRMAMNKLTSTSNKEYVLYRKYSVTHSGDYTEPELVNLHNGTYEF